MKQPQRLEVLAKANLFNLGGNPYPGRAIVAGLDETGANLVQVYWIMGRSENSRNRIFSCENGRLFTEAADLSKVKDPSLIIYNAMREAEYLPGAVAYIASNGDQTDTAVNFIREPHGFHEAMNRRQYEPDAPNFTPRITALSWWQYKGNAGAQMSILRKSPWSDACDRHLYEFHGIGRGFGYCLTTYSGGGDPLPAFQGEPYLLPLLGNARLIAENFWDTLDPDNRVSLAVKFIPKNGPSETVIKNKYKKGPFPTLAD